MAVYYPPVGFYFSVSFTGINNTNDAAFQEVTGISAEISTEEVAEGGENRFKHHLPTPPKYSNLSLKRGLLTLSSDLAKWCLSSMGSDLSSAVQPKNITVSLLDSDGKPLMAWDFINAWPIKWSISDFKSQENALAIETMEFTYNYFKKST